MKRQEILVLPGLCRLVWSLRGFATERGIPVNRMAAVVRLEEADAMYRSVVAQAAGNKAISVPFLDGTHIVSAHLDNIPPPEVGLWFELWSVKVVVV